MIRQPTPESVIEELHRIRREISDRFSGNISAIAKDAADRLACSGRPIWKPHPEADETGSGATPSRPASARGFLG
jgi:rRNA-processing protein FCF1